MKTKVWAIALLVVLGLAAIAGGVPNSLNVHGRLTSPSGSSLHGTYKMSFNIYKVATGGNPLWQILNMSVVTDANGVYNVILKNVTLNFSEQYYLGIMLQGDTEMSPRINMTASPYSLRANITESLVKQNKYIVRMLNASANMTSPKICLGSDCRTSWPSSASGGWTELSGTTNTSLNVNVRNASGSSVLFVNTTSGRVGIGTASSAATLGIVPRGTENYSLTIGTLGMHNKYEWGGMEDYNLSISPTGDIYTYGSITSAYNSGGNGAPALTAAATGDSDYAIYAGNTKNEWSGDPSSRSNLVTFSNRQDGSNLWLDNSDYSPASGYAVLHILNRPTDLGDLIGAYVGAYPGVKKFSLDTTGSAYFAGNVGIGTTSPGEKLAVNGSVNVYNASGSSVLFVNTTNRRVGIGTTSPKLPLHVVGSADGAILITGTLENIYFNATNGTGRGYLFFSPSDYRMGLVNVANGPLQFYTNNTEKVRVTSSGKVGIGTTGPDAPLSFSNAFGTKINLYDGGHYDIGIQNYLMEFIVHDSSGDFAFGYGTSGSLTRTMTIRGNGNVGIGTTSPSQKLTVNGSVNVYNASGSSKFFVNTTKGRVGIGTTAPNALLHIASGSNAQTNLFSYDRAIIESTNHAYLDIRTANNKLGGIVFSDPDATYGGVIEYDHSVDKMYFTSNRVTAMTIVGGNVGIGTMSPLYRTDIRSTSGASQLHVASSDVDSGGYLTSIGAGSLFLSGGSAWNGSKWIAKSTEATAFGAYNGALTFYTDSGLTAGNSFDINERMRIDSSGNVGIGTNSPDTKLKVVGSINITNPGNLYYDGALTPYSPLVISSADAEPIPICMKAENGDWVGCMPDSSYQWACQPNVECDIKIAKISAAEALDKSNLSTEQKAEKLSDIKEKLSASGSRDEVNQQLAAFKSETGLEVPTLEQPQARMAAHETNEFGQQAKGTNESEQPNNQTVANETAAEQLTNETVNLPASEKADLSEINRTMAQMQLSLTELRERVVQDEQRIAALEAMLQQQNGSVTVTLR